jgi:hypothetical protein
VELWRPEGQIAAARVQVKRADLVSWRKLIDAVGVELRRSMQIRGCAAFTVTVHPDGDDCSHVVERGDAT